MDKVSDWSTREQCSYCGKTWDIYPADFIKKSGAKYKVYCDHCGTSMRIEDIPTMYSRNFTELVSFNEMHETIENSGKSYEMRYLKNNCSFFK